MLRLTGKPTIRLRGRVLPGFVPLLPGHATLTLALVFVRPSQVHVGLHVAIAASRFPEEFLIFPAEGIGETGDKGQGTEPGSNQSKPDQGPGMSPIDLKVLTQHC